MAAMRDAKVFLEALATRIGELAMVELFDNSLQKMENRLVLDFILPAVWNPNHKYDLALMARVGHEAGGGMVTSWPRVLSGYTAAQVKKGPAHWEVDLDVVGYPMVSSLKNVIAKYTNPVFYYLRDGDLARSDPYMDRIWIK